MPAQGDEPAYSGPPCSNEKTSRCARCGATAVINLYVGGNVTQTYRLDDQRAVFIAECSACRKSTVAVEYGVWGEPTTQSSRPEWTRTRTETWWPTGAETTPIDESANVPSEALRFWFEANSCMSVQAYHAAAVMIRNVLSAIANDIGGTDVIAERNLEGKLKKLTGSKPQTNFLLDHMEAIKAIGNAGAHPEDWPEVTEENAETARSVARYLIEVLYEHPQRISNNLLRRNVKK